jgi:hypothetical protein
MADMKPIGSQVAPTYTLVPCILVSYARNSETLEVQPIYTSGTGIYWTVPAGVEEFVQDGAPPPIFTTPLGKHQHFKGTTYKVVCLCRDAGTLEPWVVYECPEGNRWVRPEPMFHQEVRWPDGTLRPRFVRAAAPEL